MKRTTISGELIKSALQTNEWNFGNQVLYELCKNNPQHNENSEIIAKIWLIGRAYAATIERKRNDANKIDNDDFYIKRVGPMIKESKIDNWLNSLKNYKEVSISNLYHILEVHYNVTNLFSSINGLQKRSLASKYLHFHFPNLFFIYDSRAVKGIATFSKHTGRVGNSNEKSDNEYRKFCEKCINLSNYIEEKYEIPLSPRSLDNLLLIAGKDKKSS